MISIMLGTKFRSKGTFKTAANVLVDPTTVRFRVKNPSTGIETTYEYGTNVELVKESTGVYHTDFKPSIKGDWIVRWVGDGNLDVANEEVIRVLPSQFAIP